MLLVLAAAAAATDGDVRGGCAVLHVGQRSADSPGGSTGPLAESDVYNWLVGGDVRGGCIDGADSHRGEPRAVLQFGRRAGSAQVPAVDQRAAHRQRQQRHRQLRTTSAQPRVSTSSTSPEPDPLSSFAFHFYLKSRQETVGNTEPRQNRQHAVLSQPILENKVGRKLERRREGKYKRGRNGRKQELEGREANCLNVASFMKI